MSEETGDAIKRHLESLSKQQADQGKRLSSIESALKDMAVQANQITNIQQQVGSLWNKYDYAFSPDGIVQQIERRQSACPGKQVPRLWWAVGILATLLATGGGSIILVLT